MMAMRKLRQVKSEHGENVFSTGLERYSLRQFMREMHETFSLSHFPMPPGKHFARRNFVGHSERPARGGELRSKKRAGTSHIKS